MNLKSFIETIIVRAGEITLEHYTAATGIDYKSNDTPVTAGDRNSEQYLRAEIEKAFPNDGILGEEFGESISRSGRRWILDPIDGTKTFIHQVPLYGTMISVEEGDDIIASAVYIPPLRELVIATRGGGCEWNGNPCKVSEGRPLSDSLLLTTSINRLRNKLSTESFDAILNGAGMFRTWGDCYGHILVATGRAEAMLDAGGEIWDHAPFRCIIEEAGGSARDFTGNRSYTSGTLLSSNAAIEAELRGLMQSRQV